MNPIVTVLLYFVAFGISLYALSSLNMTKLVQPVKVMQTQTLMILMAMALAYLTVQFLLGLRLILS